VIQIACSTDCLPGIPADQAAGLIRRAGFERVETAIGDSLPGLPTAVFRASLEQILSRSDAEPPPVLPAEGILAAYTALTRKASMEALVEAVENALDLVSSRAPDLRLAILNRCGSRVEQLEDLLLILQRIEQTPLRLALDAVEFHRASVNPRDALRGWIDRLSVVRLADMAGGRIVPLGEGEINIPALLERLSTGGFDGTLVVAGIVPPGTDPAARLARELQMIRDHLG